jgi:hypothetical protein
MSDYRLKIKIGEHEFEAEGAVEAVQTQFEMFKELIAHLPDRKPETTGLEDIAPSSIGTLPIVVAPMVPPKISLDRIFRQEGRIVSLTVPPESPIDAVLLVLYGQKECRNNEAPTGGEILDSLEQSGYREIRIDKILMGLSSEGAVIITGRHRGKRYRLTNPGCKRAEEIVRQAIAKLP